MEIKEIEKIKNMKEQEKEDKFSLIKNSENKNGNATQENKMKDEMTYKKIIELGNLLDESQRIVKDYEEENRRLKQEIERLRYRYSLLKASIDTVEYKIKSES